MVDPLEEVVVDSDDEAVDEVDDVVVVVVESDEPEVVVVVDVVDAVDELESTVTVAVDEPELLPSHCSSIGSTRSLMMASVPSVQSPMFIATMSSSSVMQAVLAHILVMVAESGTSSDVSV